MPFYVSTTLGNTRNVWMKALLAKKVQGYEKVAKNKHDPSFGGAEVGVIINTTKICLEQQQNFSKQELDGFINSIQRNLQQLEWQGQLTGDRVEHAIDKVQHQMACKSTSTEAS